MRRIISLSGLLLTVLLLASCNLFIDDDYVNEEGFKNVPVHEGNGYDAPVTVHQGNLEVTYQLKKDVRMLSKDDAEHYVSEVKYDAIGAFIEIHFRRDTPQNLLPVDGEILMTTVSEHFKWGACHRIQYRVDEDGVYKYIGTFVPVKDAFDDLQIDGQLQFEERQEFYVEPDEIDTDDEDEPLDAEARARRKLEQTILPHVKVVLDENGFGFEFATPLTFEANYHGLYYKIDFPVETNTYRIQNQLDFSAWNFSEGELKFNFRQTIDEYSQVKISGGYHLAKKKFFSVSPLATPIPIGPLVIVVFVDIDLSLTIDIDVTTTLSKHKKVIYDYEVDVWALTIQKKINPVEDTGFQWTDFQGSCVFTLEFAISVGIGIYGKVVSVRLIPAVTATFTVAPPSQIKDSRGNMLADLTQLPGPDLNFQLSFKLGAFLDLSLRELVGGVKEVGTAEQKKLLAELEADAQQTSDYYKDIVETDKAKGNNDIGLYTTFGPIQLGSTIKFGTWYPRLDDNSLKVNKFWDPDNREMTFVGEFAITDIGLLSKMFGKKYIPALCLMCRGKVVDYFFSEEAGMNSPITTVKAYHFYLPPMDDDKTYTVSPCYFLKGNLKSPVAIDKSLAYNASSPHAEIAMVKPVAVKRVVHTDRFAGDPKYTYTFEFDTYTDIKGMVYMSKWGISEIFTALSHPYKKSTDKKVKDGTYLMHWKVSVNTDSERTAINMALRPYFSVQQSDMTGEIVSFAMDSDKTYSITIDGNTQEGTF